MQYTADDLEQPTYAVHHVDGRVRVLASTECALGLSNWRLAPVSEAALSELRAQALADLQSALRLPGEAIAQSARVRRAAAGA